MRDASGDPVRPVGASIGQGQQWRRPVSQSSQCIVCALTPRGKLPDALVRPTILAFALRGRQLTRVANAAQLSCLDLYREQRRQLRGIRNQRVNAW